MQQQKPLPPLWVLKGTFQGKPYEQASLDICYLQSLQTKVLRNDGTGHIIKIK
jgi:hypothetical protein